MLYKVPKQTSKVTADKIKWPQWSGCMRQYAITVKNGNQISINGINSLGGRDKSGVK